MSFRKFLQSNVDKKAKIRNVFGVAFIVFCVTILLVLGFHEENLLKKEKWKRNVENLVLDEGEYGNAAVSADGLPCATIGKDVLQEGGTAIDSAIATLFCVGVVNAQSMGLGGGFFLTYYKRASQKAFTLDARETAPRAAFKDMYEGNAHLSTHGGLAVAVPGEIRGYWEAYQRFGGGVSWRRLIEPTAKLCEDGYPVNHHMANSLRAVEKWISTEPSMSVFINPETYKVWSEGDIIRRPVLAKTLRILQQEPDAIYTGKLANAFLQDLQDLGSIITRIDMKNYLPIWRDPYPMSFGGKYTLYSTPPPGSGLILGYIMRILQHYKFTSESINLNNIITTYQRITEAFKFAYARRTELGDSEFHDMKPLVDDLLSDKVARKSFKKIQDSATSQDPTYYGSNYSLVEDHGTAQVSIIGPNGDAVSVTSTINLYFGAGIRSNSTGIILNDEMNDFSIPKVTNNFHLPPFEANYIEPGKRPVSSMCPVIVVNKKGDAILVNGAAGGTLISSAVAWTSIHNLWFGQTITQAINTKRLHHQLYPMELLFENGFNKNIITALENIGHVTSHGGRSAIAAVERMIDGRLRASSDARKGGGVDGF